MSSMVTLKPPSDRAVEEAIFILLKSIRYHNQLHQRFVVKDGPECDEMSMDDITHNVEALKVGTRMLRKRVITLIAALNCRHNAMLRMTRLPNEVLEDILLYSMEGSTSHIQRAAKLATVSKQWAEVVRSPRFWAVIDNKHSLRTVERCLERAKNAPLRIVVKTERSLDEMEGFMSLVVQRSRQWESFDFRCNASPLNHLINATPSLRDVSLCCPDRFRPIAFSDGPHFHNVTLEWCTIPWDSARLANLQSLAVLSPRTSPPIADLLRILSLSPTLEKLQLRNIVQPPDDASAIPDTTCPAIHLPNLRSLNIDQLHTSYYSHILSRLYAPACSSVLLGTYGMHALHTKLFEKPKGAFGALVETALRSAEGVRLRVYDNRLTLTAERKASVSGSEVPIPSIIDTPVKSPRRMARFFASLDAPASLSITLQRVSVSFAPLLSIPSLTRLIADESVFNEARQYLSQEQKLFDDGPPVWPGARLEEIVFRFSKSYRGIGYVGDGLLEFVRARWGAIQSGLVQPAMVTIVLEGMMSCPPLLYEAVDKANRNYMTTTKVVYGSRSQELDLGI
ncbi:hypothetical protein FRB99_002483 [Tulasnella sp. 403]|nr:hypothetical protein FRB99_002483 [Tulasnella sp. 403]